MLKFKHYTVAVHDLESAVESYEQRFGMGALGERAHNGIGNFDFVPMGYGDDVLLHLIQPSSDDSPIHRLMQDRTNEFNPHGEGIYLLAFECDDPEAFAAQVEEAGGRVTKTGNSRNLWVHPMSSNFVLMELFPPPGQ
jgi:predicted enzyme related to lactoylglutathione lyase